MENAHTSAGSESLILHSQPCFRSVNGLLAPYFLLLTFVLGRLVNESRLVGQGLVDLLDSPGNWSVLSQLSMEAGSQKMKTHNIRSGLHTLNSANLGYRNHSEITRQSKDILLTSEFDLCPYSRKLDEYHVSERGLSIVRDRDDSKSGGVVEYDRFVITCVSCCWKTEPFLSNIIGYETCTH